MLMPIRPTNIPMKIFTRICLLSKAPAIRYVSLRVVKLDIINERSVAPKSIWNRYSECLQARGVEGLGEEVVHCDGFSFALEVGQDDRNVAAELPDQLATGATGRGERVGIGDNRDGVEAALAFADGFEDGHSLGANREPVGGVFYVAASE